MKKGFFLKIACGNIRKNFRFFIPRIAAEAGLLAVFYIVSTLKNDERIAGARGGNTIDMLMSIGIAVMMMLSVILMFYVSGFLMRQRRYELGLYNVLGMEKRHVGRVLFYESMLSSAAAVGAGLVLGILFYKICLLLVCLLLRVEPVMGFYYIKPADVLLSAAFFIALDAAAFLFHRLSIARMKPVELLSSGERGEKEPRVKGVILIAGVIALGGGYAISLTVSEPLQAILLFFAAVILVIIGTYFLFTSGSIFVLKALKKNERFYYDRRHMTAVSGLLYRMKRNAVGLASVCILSTGVLVMVSTTVSLYSGMQEAIDLNYPRHYYVSTSVENDRYSRLPDDTVKDIVERAAEDCGMQVKDVRKEDYLQVSYRLSGNRLLSGVNDMNLSDNLAGLSQFTFMTQETFTGMGGRDLCLEPDEIAVFPLDGKDGFDGEELELHGRIFRVRKAEGGFPDCYHGMISPVNRYGAVLCDQAVMDWLDEAQKRDYGPNAGMCTHLLSFDFADEQLLYSEGTRLGDAVREEIGKVLEEAGVSIRSVTEPDSVWDARDAMLGMYGSLLFLGIMLGMVCLFAAVLIIYYKQISEGYEDLERFSILKRIGMSSKEIKKTIDFQVLLVFFLPLIMAGVHLLFAFPILDKLLHVLLLSSTKLFALCAMVTYLVFALVYTVIYLGTARTYYRITDSSGRAR